MVDPRPPLLSHFQSFEWMEVFFFFFFLRYSFFTISYNSLSDWGGIVTEGRVEVWPGLPPVASVSGPEPLFVF